MTDMADTITQDAKASLPEAAAKTPKSNRTWGGRIHNELTYRVIDWLMNSTFGVATTFWAERTESGKRIFSDRVSGGFRWALKHVSNNEKSIAEGAKWGSRFTSIMMGGFAIIPPLIFMENKQRKKNIIRWLDEKIYGRDVVANDPKFNESYDKIDAEPKKGFLAGLGARMLALAPLLAVTFTPDINKHIIKWGYDPISKITRWTTENVLRIKPGPDSFLMKMGPLEHLDGDPKGPLGSQTHWNFLHRTIGFDFGLTFLYSFIHEVAYKFVAGMGRKQPKNTAPDEVPAQPQAVMAAGAQPEVKEAFGKWSENQQAIMKPRPEKAVNHVQAIENRSAADSLAVAGQFL